MRKPKRITLTARHCVDAEVDVTVSQGRSVTGWRLHPRIITIEDGANSSLVASEAWNRNAEQSAKQPNSDTTVTDGTLACNGTFKLFGTVQLGEDKLADGSPRFDFDEATVTVEQIEHFAAMLLRLATEIRKTGFGKQPGGPAR